ncbi:hypothetical protein X975_25404, partial [Stegodyphus mimosarum]
MMIQAILMKLKKKITLKKTFLHLKPLLGIIYLLLDSHILVIIS